MMKKAMACMLIMALLTSCSTKGEGGGKSKKAEIPKTEAAAEPSETGTADNLKTVEESAALTADSMEEPKTKTQIGEKIEPLLSEKIDASKQGMLMSLDKKLSSEMARGDDGCCYYFRNEGKEENKKIEFYKNNGIKVCETAMKKSLEKKKYFILSFVKYMNYFFLALESPDTYTTILTTMEMETGKWGETIKTSGSRSVIVYDNKFYLIDNGDDITVYDLSGTKTKLKFLCLSPKAGVRHGEAKCIVDGKIYYVIQNRKKNITKIMRCSLDGKNRKELFKCSGTCIGLNPETMKMDESSIYLSGYNDSYNLIRIPLYGGKIERVAEKTGGWFELSDDSVFFFDYDDFDDYDTYRIYRIGKNLEGKPEEVAKAYYIQYGLYNMMSAPFYYADGHLLVQGYNDKEMAVVDGCLDSDFLALWAEVSENYAPDWYWVSEDGEIEYTIKGSGVKKKWKKAAKESARISAVDPWDY